MKYIHIQGHFYGIPICANCKYFERHTPATTDNLGHCSKKKNTVDGEDDSALCPHFIWDPPCLRKKEQSK